MTAALAIASTTAITPSSRRHDRPATGATRRSAAWRPSCCANPSRGSHTGLLPFRRPPWRPCRQRYRRPSRERRARGQSRSRATAKIALRHDDGDGLVRRTVSGMEATIEVTGLRKRFGPTVALDGLTFTVIAGKRDRLRRPQRGGQVDHDAGDPRPGRRRRGHRADRRAAVREPAPPAHPRRLAARRRRAAPRPQRAIAPAVDGPFAGPDVAPGRRGDRAGRPGVGGATQGGRLLAGNAPAAGRRRGDARRPADLDARRAVQRPRSRGNRVDARLPALARRRGPGRVRLQPPDERVAGHGRPT